MTLYYYFLSELEKYLYDINAFMLTMTWNTAMKKLHQERKDCYEQKLLLAVWALHILSYSQAY